MAQFADEENLTPLGKSAKRRLQKVCRNARGHAGQLTRLGERQHRSIAHRMATNYPEVFEGDDTWIQARSSTVPRCRASMLAFCGELQRCHRQLTIDPQTEPAFMVWLNHESDDLKAYTRRVPSTSTALQGGMNPDRFIRALFVDGTKVKEPLKLLSELHTIASDMQDIPLDINLWDLFSPEEMQAVHDANNVRMTLCNGDTLANEGIPARSSVPLWEDIERQADDIIARGGHGATLRFGHDTALYRLLTLLGVELPGDGMEDIVPMAANLQMVFFKKAGEAPQPDDVLVTFLLNEHPSGLGTLRNPSNPNTQSDRSNMRSQRKQSQFYYWSELKAYMHERIHDLEHLRQLSALNTMVGTAPANTQSAGLFGKGSEEHGQTLPAVLVPNGQTFWTPQTRDTERKCVAPYYYTDTLFQGIRASHWLVGGCTQDYGSFTVMALGSRSNPSDQHVPGSRFSHADEESHPYYYSVRLPDERLRIEVTGLSHAAVMRVTPSCDQDVRIVLRANSDEQQATVAVDSVRRVVTASNPVHRIYQGWGEPAGFSGHIALRYVDETVHIDRSEDHVTLTFRGQKGKPILLSMATSFTSQQGAIANLDAEATDFDTMERQNIALWTARLHTIDVEDPDTARVNQFYGALYRASFLPREMSDVDGAAPKFGLTPKSITPNSLTPNPSLKERGVYSSGHRSSSRKSNYSPPYREGSGVGLSYGDFSMWDTYRALHPLLCIIAPQESADMMQSLTEMYQEGGWLPIFPCWNSYTAAMIGDHCAATIADAYVKGIRGFDAAKAYEGMRKNAFETPATEAEYRDGMGRRALTSYMQYGYIPLEDSVKEAYHQQEQTSRTLEYAFDDFAVAQMARLLGHDDDYRALMQRSQNWRNVINPLTGYADGRYADGRWAGCTDLTHRQPFITEGAICHYAWYVPHDVEGLADVMGGRERCLAKLDSMFAEGRYWHGNEPCHQVAWLYSVLGDRRTTARRVAHILQTEYNDTPGGLSGNDDAGQMSAWQVFASMGFYPVCPATPRYVLGAPAFRRITINQPGRQPFVIEAAPNSHDAEPRLNGQPLQRTYITHDELLQGGHLEL
ncbi:MAG: GH92 family glycosyl hydrolase [Prevotella sp.]|nr:GH92 family glycosyl hydrolase [Prevotella sp.]